MQEGAAGVSADPSSGTLAALQAIDREDILKLEELLSNGAFNVNACIPWRGDVSIAPLHLAAAHAALLSIQALVEASASANVTDSRGWSCLHHLCASSVDDDIKTQALAMLLQAGADADATTQTHQTVLHIAARQSSTGTQFLARVIIAVRETNACDAAGRTALHYVALSTANSVHNLELAQVLIKYANIDARDADAEGRSAADVAEARGKSELAAGLRTAEARAASNTWCCCFGGRWIQPLLLTCFIGFAHTVALFHCLPCMAAWYPTAALASLLVVCGAIFLASCPLWLDTLHE